MTEALLSLLLVPVAYIVRGWVLCVLWAWFIVPTFHMPTLRIPIALGIGMLIGMLTKSVNYQKDDPSYTIGMKTAVDILGPLAVLGMAWVVRIFI